MADCWNNYKNPDIAARQRGLVDRQLKDMHNGSAPGVFRAIEPALWHIHVEDQGIYVLDAGCASGYYKEVIDFYAPGLVGIYHGVDSNSGMIAMAQRRYPGYWSNWDITNLDQLDNNSWDLVFSSGTIQHIKDWQQAVHELARVTKRWLLLHRTRMWTDDDTETESFPEPAYGVPLNCWIFNRKEMTELLESCGMSMELELPAGEGPIGDAIKREGWHIKLQLWRRLDGNG